MAVLDTFTAPDAVRLVARIFAENFKPPPRLTVSQWADGCRILSRKGAAEPGPYRTARTPYLQEPMDFLSPSSPVEEVVLMFAAQLGKSEAGNNFVGHTIDIDPGPMMIVQPTIDMAKRYSRQRIAPMIEETPALRKRVKENRSRDESNTTLVKDFTGGMLILAGANSAAGLRSTPVKKLFLDEIDAYPLDVDGEGDPIMLAEKRTATFVRRKVLKTSTPTTKGFSRVEQSFDRGDRRKYHVPCPHCAAPQVMKFDHLHWIRDDVGAPIPGSVRYVCPSCGGAVQEHQKPAMLAAGKWIAERPTDRIASYHLSALYSPWLSWEQVVAEFYDANETAKAGDVSKLKAWTNTVLSETWEEQGDKVSEHELAKRAEPLARRLVPRNAMVLTIGADVQGDRIELRTWGWGRGEESWLIERDIVHGSPSDEQTWKAVLEVIEREYEHENGARMRVMATAIDSGGHHTQEVYNFCRVHAWRKVIAVKGQSQSGKAVIGKPSDVDVSYRGVKLKRGAKVWPVGTDTAKQVLYGRLRLSQHGGGYVHLPNWLPAEEYEQLTAERLVTKYYRGRPRLEWMKPPGRRNEALDCAVYAMAAAHMLGMPRWREIDWQKLEHRLRQADLLKSEIEAPTSSESSNPNETTAAAPDSAQQHQHQPRRIRRVGSIGGIR